MLLLLVGLALSASSRAFAGMVTVSEADNGRELTLSRGDTLEVSLPATSGTGYTWQPVPIADPLAKPVGDMKFKTDHEMPRCCGTSDFPILSRRKRERDDRVALRPSVGEGHSAGQGLQAFADSEVAALVLNCFTSAICVRYTKKGAESF